ncbi:MULTISPECIES: CU044_5270 family protein [unclassified Curtobacterium]|uniref:CU044_5270 family protein n=1 Tax=unclassified Curtobacterium TaxID=257496 RepID=UPI00226B118C|nr:MULTISPECIES: CU044_5270 family protein [unclassified Curtobacterium]
MPDFTTLRAVRSEVDDLPPAVVDAALHRARARMSAAPVAPVRRRRPVLLTAAAVVAVGALTGAVVGVAHLTAPDSAAAATLHDAARAAAASGSASPAAYTRVTVTELALGYATSDGEHYDEGYLAPTTTVTWVPRSVAGQWVRQSWSEPATVFYGGTAAREAARSDFATSAHRDDPARQRALAGAFTNGELGGTAPGTLTAVDVAGLPRDPAALVRRIEDAPRAKGASDTEHVFDTVASFLRLGIVPEDLRATMFEVLADLPGIVVTEEQTSLDGRRGTAIGLSEEGDDLRQEVIIDRSGGEYLGERTLQTRRTGSIPAGTVVDSASVVTTPVGSVPEN